MLLCFEVGVIGVQEYVDIGELFVYIVEDVCFEGIVCQIFIDFSYVLSVEVCVNFELLY